MFYSREVLEKKADSINRQHFPERLSTPSVFDPYDFLEAIGCEYEWKYISPDDSILGMTFFGDGGWYVWPKGVYTTGDRPTFETFRKGTVVINQRLLDSNRRFSGCRETFVATHEGAHWVKDRDYFENQSFSLFQTCRRNDFNDSELDFDLSAWGWHITVLENIESETNYLAAAIIMPRDVVVDAFFSAGRLRQRPKLPVVLEPHMNDWIADVAKMFGMNFNPVKYRLKNLKVITENE